MDTKTEKFMCRKMFIAAFLLIGLLQTTRAVDWYVATNGAGWGTNGWADATNSLQGAINAASTSTYDVVWVSNGVYDTGGIKGYPAGTSLTNRVAITKAITVRSKDNDPTNTIIVGGLNSPTATNGPAAIRCVYMAANSRLIGFTLSNGATMKTGSSDDFRGAGVFCPAITSPLISNCIITANSAYYGGGAYYGTFRNCAFIGNYATTIDSWPAGGGSYGGILFDCVLTGNCARASGSGGGAQGGVLSNCIVNGNSGDSGGTGGGAYAETLYNCRVMNNFGMGAGASTLYNCTVINNRGSVGGIYLSTAYNCIITNNVSWDTGGGAKDCILYNCLVYSNRASFIGGGTSAGTNYNCTIVKNTCADGGGVYGGKMINCVIYFNIIATGSGNLSSNCGGTVYFTNTCTAPASNGWAVGNIVANPLFVDTATFNYRLSVRSPCINAGTNLSWMSDGSARSKDLDGMQRLRYWTVDMGAYEHIRSGTIYGFR